MKRPNFLERRTRDAIPCGVLERKYTIFNMQNARGSKKN